LQRGQKEHGIVKALSALLQDLRRKGSGKKLAIEEPAELEGRPPLASISTGQFCVDVMTFIHPY
jgi:hypothetical protein